MIRESGDIDVHIVAHAAAGRRTLPKIGGALSPRRRLMRIRARPRRATAADARVDRSLAPTSRSRARSSLFQLLVVTVALVGGIWPALVAAVLAGLPPRLLLRRADPQNHDRRTTALARPRHLRHRCHPREHRRRPCGSPLAGRQPGCGGVRDALPGGGERPAWTGRPRRARRATARGLWVGRRRAGENDTPSTARWIRASPARMTLRRPSRSASRPTSSCEGMHSPHPTSGSSRPFCHRLEAALEQRALAREAADMRPLAEADQLRTALLGGGGPRPPAPPRRGDGGGHEPAIDRGRALQPRTATALLETADESLDVPRPPRDQPARREPRAGRRARGVDLGP